MVLHLPDVVETDPVRNLDLVECVLQQPMLGALGPWSRQLVFVEDPELHRVSPVVGCHSGQRYRQ
jgi:hypothetical protein